MPGNNSRSTAVFRKLIRNPLCWFASGLSILAVPAWAGDKPAAVAVTGAGAVMPAIAGPAVTGASDGGLQAGIDERVVQSMSKSGYDKEQVREEVGKGCDGGGGMSGDMAICAAYSYHRAAVALNDKYLELVSRLEEPTAQEDLQRAQAAWNEYQDAQCRFDTTSWTGGSFRRVAIAMCRESMSMNRTQQLSEFLKCAPEDPDCPALHKEPASLSK